MNRYERKRAHKRALKKRHAIHSGTYDPELDKEKERSWYEENIDSKWADRRNNGYQYWDEFYLSGRKTFAKRSTNRRIRSMYREKIATENHAEINAHQGADYQKEFDYAWEVW